MIIVTVIVGVMIVMRIRSVGIAMIVRVIVMFNGIAARIARMRTDDGNQPGEDSADQRQGDDCLNHPIASPPSDGRLRPRSSRGCDSTPPVPPGRSPLPPRP